MSVSRLTHSYTFTEDRIADLLAVIPEAFKDGAIDWETLRDGLGVTVETDSSEHFGLNWPGKRAARKLAGQPSHGALAPVPGEGINEASTSNLFIEGDNLEVLKLLQKSYAGTIKVIYIDPPYNTGQDFIYRDDFSEPTEEYLRRTGQRGERGELLTSNPKAGGRFHSSWLSMMYPRLRLARTLLKDDGVIFISIDDNEFHNLRQLMDEVFGPECFLATVLWQKKYAPANDTVDFSPTHDYILVYSKTRNYAATGKATAVLGRTDRTESQNKAYINPDNDERGPWKPGDYTCNKSADQRPNLYYPITHPKTGAEVWPKKTGVWRYSKDRHAKNIADNRVWWGVNQEANVPAYKRFLSEVGGVVSDTWWDHQQVGHNDEAKKQLKALFPESNQIFDTPKPTRLIKRILQLSTSNGDDGDPAIFLDFFAGSCSSAHACLELISDGANLAFIMVQVPEPASNSGFDTIAEIGKERIRRVIADLNAEHRKQPKLPVDQPNPDLGFRSYRLTSSNFRRWQGFEEDDIAKLQLQLDQFETPLIDTWTREDLLTEVMLMEGFPLDSQVELRSAAKGLSVSIVTSSKSGHRLIVTFDGSVSAQSLLDIRIVEDDTVVCFDSALDDNGKLLLGQHCNLKTI